MKYDFDEGDADAMKKFLDSCSDEVSLAWATMKVAEGDDAPEGASPEERPEYVCVGIEFSERGFGFGEVTIKQTADGAFVDTECTSKERVKRYLCALVDGAVADTDEDPARHARFNAAMGRACNEHCRACAAGAAGHEGGDG